MNIKKTIFSLLAALMLLAMNPVQATVGPPTAAGQIDTAFAQAAHAHGVREGQLRAICYAETGSWSARERPTEVSPTSAAGICQITARTAGDHCPDADLLDLRENIDCAARIIRWQMTHYCGTDFVCNAGSYLCGPTGYRMNCYTNRSAWPKYRHRAIRFLEIYRAAHRLHAVMLAIALEEPALALAFAGGVR